MCDGSSHHSEAGHGPAAGGELLLSADTNCAELRPATVPASGGAIRPDSGRTTKQPARRDHQPERDHPAAERPDRVKAILAVETSPTAFDEIPAEGRQRLAKIPIYIVIGDRAKDRVDASRKFQREMSAIGGVVTVDVLPEAGIHGNGHTMMLEKNNKQIMYRMIAWLEGNIFKPK